MVIIMKLKQHHMYLPSVVNVGWFEESTEIMVGRVEIDIEDSIWKHDIIDIIFDYRLIDCTIAAMIILKLLFFLSNIKKTFFHHVQKFKTNNKNVGRRTSQSMFRESFLCFLFYRSPGWDNIKHSTLSMTMLNVGLFWRV